MLDVNKLFIDRETGAKYQKSLLALNSRLNIKSRSQQLLDCIRLAPDIWLPARQNDICEFETTCMVDTYPKIQDLLHELPASPTRKIHDHILGRCNLFIVPTGIVLTQKDRGKWTLLRTMDGRYLCLLEDDPLEESPQQLPNVAELFGIIASDMLAMTNKHIVHAAAVGQNNNACLITGLSGAGKTTFTLDLVTKGWDFFGDDMVIIGASETNQWQVWPYWRAVNITRQTCTILPSLESHQGPDPWSGKKSIGVETLFQIKKPSPARISAIYYLDPQADSIPERLAPQQTIQLLGETFLSLFFPDAAINTLDFLMDITHEIPVWRIGRETNLNKHTVSGISQNTQKPLQTL